MDTRDAGRLGGLARTANMTPEELKAATSKAGRSRWDQMTPEQREAHMAKMQAASRRRRAMRDAAQGIESATVADSDAGEVSHATVADSGGDSANRREAVEASDAPPHP